MKHWLYIDDQQSGEFPHAYHLLKRLRELGLPGFACIDILLGREVYYGGRVYHHLEIREGRKV